MTAQSRAPGEAGGLLIFHTAQNNVFSCFFDGSEARSFISVQEFKLYIYYSILGPKVNPVVHSSPQEGSKSAMDKEAH